LKVAYDAWRVGNAGAPIIRLKTRLDWPSLLGAIALIMACYYVNQQFLFSSPLLGIVLGMGTVAGAGVLGALLMTEKFDLCENGVMLSRWTFLPWAGIRLVRWKRDGNGALVLRSGWRRIAAKVPREHREVVDRVLHEKLSPETSAAQLTSD
jgi:hypothetical protein